LSQISKKTGTARHLNITAEAEKSLNEPLDHVLFASPPGLSKMTLAQIVSRELGVGFRSTSCAAAMIVFYSSAVLAQAPMANPEEMWAIIQEQPDMLEEPRSEIDAPKIELAMVQTGQDETEEAGSRTQAASIETQLAMVEASANALSNDPYLALAGIGATSASGGWWNQTSLGGYGELHYNGGPVDKVDFHRFVLFVGHEFTNNIRLFSEIELEHALAGDDKPGEVELEQAFVQIDVNDQHRVNAGVLLVPVGILNETHEPPTFFGVERNGVEKNIIPSTWWEAGIGLNGNLGASGFSYDLLASSGLNAPTTGSSAFKIRSGRQKVAKATAKSPSLTGRLSYTGIPGLQFATSGHYEFDITQSAGDPITGDKVPAFLLSTHADARFGGFGLRALFASWWVGGDGASEIGRDRQTGFYLEPSYRFPLEGVTIGADPSEVGFFYRYSWWDNNAGMSSLKKASNQHTLGVNYWPHPNVAFKLDYLMDRPKSGANTNRVDLGIGFQF